MFVASRSECAASATVSIYDRAARMRRERDDTFERFPVVTALDCRTYSYGLLVMHHYVTVFLRYHP